jgi:DNA-binding HxlR family transcriptional regulator
LEIFGDRWTLLVIRDLFLGKSRFKDFLASPEGIPTNILTERLNRLLVHCVVVQIPEAGGSRHLAYQLTPKGKALLPVLKTVKDWGLSWEKGTRADLEPS